MVVFWFRRDLRLNDNHGFYEALSSGEEVLPIFIFDKKILDDLPKDDHRVTFIHALLTKMQDELKEHNRKLAIFHDTPEEAFKKIVSENNITAVYTNHDYEPYAEKRDSEIGKFLNTKNIIFNTYKDQVIFEKSEVTKDDGKPYTVYTPYSKKWKAELKKRKPEHYPSEKHLAYIAAHSYPFLTLNDIGFKESNLKPLGYSVTPSVINEYEDKRNYPAIKGTSRLSVYLRFGAVSIREMVRKADAETNETFLNELIWREFFMQILWHFPETVTKSFRPKYDNIKWRNNEKEFAAWCEGKTGYPMVDAGMRELNATGYMHNRVRLVVSSFLCKHLLIDWRRGEAYFAEKLFDYEQSSNVGNWQWAAGSGTDAAPYFRVFNPSEQAKKFDPEFKYIGKWVPEFQELSY
ncbi:deoxyribodipyrimidine photolyase, partial [Nostoc linckia z16]